MFKKLIKGNLHKFWDWLSYFLILLNIILVPLFLDNKINNAYIMPKSYLFFSLLLVNLLLWSVRVLINKKISHRKSFLDWCLLGLLVVSFFSTIFSVDVSSSFFGRTDYFTINFFVILFSVIFYLILINQLNTQKRWYLVLDTLLVVGGISTIIFLLKVYINTLFPGWSSIFNTISSFSSLFGIWVVFHLILLTGLLMQKGNSVKRTLFYLIFFILHLIALIVLGFSMMWWLLFVGFVLLLCLGIFFVKQIRLLGLYVVFVSLVLSLVFIIFGSPKTMQAVLPAEISLAIPVSWEITYQTIFSSVKNFF